MWLGKLRCVLADSAWAPCLTEARWGPWGWNTKKDNRTFCFPARHLELPDSILCLLSRKWRGLWEWECVCCSDLAEHSRVPNNCLKTFKGLSCDWVVTLVPCTFGSQLERENGMDRPVSQAGDALGGNKSSVMSGTIGVVSLCTPHFWRTLLFLRGASCPAKF